MINNKAGSLNTYLQKWQEFTSDPEILDTVSGMTIEFDGAHKIPQPRANHCSKWEKTCICNCAPYSSIAFLFLA